MKKKLSHLKRIVDRSIFIFFHNAMRMLALNNVLFCNISNLELYLVTALIGNIENGTPNMAGTANMDISYFIPDLFIFFIPHTAYARRPTFSIY
jgi:hypothetical protein